MPSKDFRLITHAASLPIAFDLLQADDVGIAHGIGDAPKIVSLVESQSETNIVADDFHSTPVRPCPEPAKRSKDSHALPSGHGSCRPAYIPRSRAADPSGEFRRWFSRPDPAQIGPERHVARFLSVALYLVAYVHQVVADGVCKHRL